MDQTPSNFTSGMSSSSQPDSFMTQPISSSSTGNHESPRPANSVPTNGHVNGNYNSQNYGMYPYYPPGPQQQQQYPHNNRPYPPYPPNGINGRYNEQYPSYPHSQFYPMPPMGAPGPGPGTMQNYSGGPNAPYQDYPNSNFIRQPYPRSYQPDTNAPSQSPSNYNEPASSENNGSMNEAPPYTSHPPPPSIPPPGPPIPNHNGQAGQGQGGDYPTNGGYYWPSGHPYSYGGGVGYTNPGMPYGYSYDPYNQPQHSGLYQHSQPYPVQHAAYQQQHHHSSTQNWNAMNGHAPHQRENSNQSMTSATASGSGSKLNPAAAGFTFTPGKKDAPAAGGSTPVFASLAQPSTQSSQPTQSSASAIPNGTSGPTTAAQGPKKFALPVVVNGEKLKGMSLESASGLVFGSQQPELDSAPAPALGLSQMETSSTTTSATSPETFVSDSTPLTQSVTSASTPASPTTPTSSQTPRANNCELQAEEASILFSPTSAGSSSTEGLLRFVGSPISGYSSPQSLSSAAVTVMPPKKKKIPTVIAEPYILAVVRPDLGSAAGVTYNAGLGKTIPKTYKVETLDQGEPDLKRTGKTRTRGKPSAGAIIIIGTKKDVAPKSQEEVITFGEIAELTPRAADVAIPEERKETAVSESTEPVTATRPKERSDVEIASAPKVTEEGKNEKTPAASNDSQSTNAQSQDETKPEPLTAPALGQVTPVTAPAPTAPKAKPSSWASLLKPASKPDPKAQASKTKSEARAQKVVEANDQVSTGPEEDGSRTPVVRFAENEAGPSRLPQAPAPSAPKANGTAKPAFNYAAAAAANAGLTPAEELAKMLAEGLTYQQLMGKGKGKEIGMVPRGLINTGNMCFANTILQVLVYCPPFTELFEELGKRLKADLARKTPLLEAMIIFLREFAPGPQSTPAEPLPTPPASGSSTPRDNARSRDPRKEAFVPENVYDAMKENKRFDSMRRGHQEDAEEYLGFFLNTLHEELLYLLSRTAPPKPQSLPNGTEHGKEEDEVSIQRPVSPDAETDGDGWLEVGKKQKTNVVRATETRESAITRLFGGTIRSILTTPGMKNSVTLEPYQPLQLDIQSPEITSITDALRHLSQPEIVPGVWSASRKANVDATKQITVETFPRVLILHLKRFVFEMSELSVVKKSKPVAYGTELVIPPEIISPGRRQQPVKYRLFGVVYHHGYSAGGGHYTVSVSRPDTTLANSQWIHFDDETVSTVPTDQVVVSEQEARDVKEGKIRDGGLTVGGRERCAYLLFYQRVRA